MGEQTLSGTPASPGVALGNAWRLADATAAGGGRAVAPDRREHERCRALEALSAAAQALSELAIRLPRDEAEIVETGALMARDPALAEAVEQATLTDGLTAPAAILEATRRHADAIAAIGDELLAARADDVRSLGRRAARIAIGEELEAPAGSDRVLVASELGPGDVAELAPALAGVALAGGGATAHAAIVARSLGIPMATGLGRKVLGIADGLAVMVDGTAGTVTVSPSAERALDARADMAARRQAMLQANELRDEPAITTDGTRITVLANVATPEELRVGLLAGAEGIGLLRSELAFLDAGDWPSEQQHADALRPILSGLGGRRAIVRVLDFGADKAPPFLRGTEERGIALLLAHPDAFLAQLRAIVAAAQTADVLLLLPMVETPAQLAKARALLSDATRSLGARRAPSLGSMIETPEAVANADAIAAHSDFLSIGTNDLTASTLGSDRFAVSSARAHEPRVLRSIARTVAAAHAAGITIEVCGEAASDPIMLPLLVGLGIDELSVGAAQVGQVRSWVRRLDAAESAGLARSALTMDSAAEVESARRPLAAGV